MADNTINWGQATVNNNIDFGGAKANSTNGFGAVYENSPSGDTDIVGTPLSITYSASDYCDGIGDTPQPTVAGNSGVGTFSSTVGLIINSNTGVIDVNSSTKGTTYIVTYTDTDSDIVTANVTLNPSDNAAFSYSASRYEPTDANPTPTITGLTGGTFSGSTGLVINSATGEIDLSASTEVLHTITYDTSSSGSSVCPNTLTQTVLIAFVVPNNYSMNFDAASSDYLQVSNTTDFDFGTADFTWSLWINYETHVNYSGLLYTGDSNSEYRLKFQTSGQILYLQNADGDSQVADLGTNITGTGWHHLCLVRSSGTITTYLDGSDVDTDSRVGNLNSNGNDLLIGKNNTSYFDGAIDEVGIWDTALTSTQVSEIYNATSTNLTKDLTTVSGSNLKYWNRMGD